MKVEVGYFFCSNCCRVAEGHINVPYENNPKKPCVTCGMEQWIYEPTEGEVTIGEQAHTRSR